MIASTPLLPFRAAPGVAARLHAHGCDATGSGPCLRVFRERRVMRTDVNWYGVLAHHAARTPEKAMTVFEGEVLTYAQMDVRVEDAGRRVAGQGGRTR